MEISRLAFSSGNKCFSHYREIKKENLLPSLCVAMIESIPLYMEQSSPACSRFISNLVHLFQKYPNLNEIVKFLAEMIIYVFQSKDMKYLHEIFQNTNFINFLGYFEPTVSQGKPFFSDLDKIRSLFKIFDVSFTLKRSNASVITFKKSSEIKVFIEEFADTYKIWYPKVTMYRSLNEEVFKQEFSYRICSSGHPMIRKDQQYCTIGQHMLYSIELEKKEVIRNAEQKNRRAGISVGPRRTVYTKCFNCNSLSGEKLYTCSCIFCKECAKDSKNCPLCTKTIKTTNKPSFPTNSRLRSKSPFRNMLPNKVSINRPKARLFYINHK